MHSKQQLQKVFYLPLEYQIFLQSSTNLSTSIFPYSFQCYRRLQNFGNSNSTFLTTPNQRRGKLSQTAHSGFMNLTPEFNQYSISSQNYFKSFKKMADNDVVFVETVNQNSTNHSREGPLYFGGNEVTITKCIQTKVLSEDVSKNTNSNNQEIVHVKSISNNSVLSKRKTPPSHDNGKRSKWVEANVSSSSSHDEMGTNCPETNKTTCMVDEKSKMLMESPISSGESSSQYHEPCLPQGSDLTLNISHNLQFDSSMSTNSGDASSNASACMTSPSEHKITEDSQVNQVKIMSYNILAQTLLVRHGSLYHHCLDDRMLEEEYRLNNIIREILSYKCDIVCLQEVEHKIVGYIVDKLSDYKYIYKKRTGGNIDGCCILYKHSKYAVVNYKFVEYFKPASHSLLTKHNVGVIIHLKSSQHRIIVANTHLLYNPRHSDVRYEQCKLLLRQIKHLYDSSAHSGTSVVITGDLNSKTNSKLVDFILNNNYKDFKFKSAYDFNYVSTYHDYWTLVDYIFYSNNTLKLLSHKLLPRNRDAIDRIPNKCEGSDHFALVALFSTD
uniref:Protein angel n=1 Tax=Cacopsylla melanoneura TaxID=428564 RepID=A0A8D8SAQ2_9HEMI